MTFTEYIHMDGIPVRVQNAEELFKQVSLHRFHAITACQQPRHVRFHPLLGPSVLRDTRHPGFCIQPAYGIDMSFSLPPPSCYLIDVGPMFARIGPICSRHSEMYSRFVVGCRGQSSRSTHTLPPSLCFLPLPVLSAQQNL